jgi:hypothetical protein
MNTDDLLIGSIIDELGIDVYHIYPTSKRLIPETVIWAIASACLIEFLKGLGGFNNLGQQTRAKLDEFLRRWRTRDSFEPYIQTLNLQKPIADGMHAIRQVPPASNDFEKARKSLEDSLIEFGLHSSDAHEHAIRISELISQAMQTK